MAMSVKAKPRTQPPEKRRDDLMNAAQKLFLANGILGTTIEQIALGADLSKGAFYLHFDSKEEIHLALCERFHRHFVESVSKAIAKRDSDDWRGKVATWARASVSGLLDNGDLVNMLFHAHPLPPSAGWFSEVVEPLLDVLNEGAAAGAWQLSDPKFTAIFLFSGLHGAVDEVLMNKRRTSRERLTNQIEAISQAVLALRA